MSPRLTSFVLLASIVFAAGAPPAQVPEGHAVICTVTESGAPGAPGLFVVSLDSGVVTPITGLPANLVTAANYLQGAFEVSIRPSDGALIVTTLASPQAPNSGDHELWIFHLNGLAVDPARTQLIVLGTATAVGGSRHRVLPDGRILVHSVQVGTTTGSVMPLPSGPMANHLWGIVDVSGASPVFTLLPNPPGIAGQEFVSFCLDPTGRYVYYTLSFNFHGTPANASLLRYELATGLECTIANWPGESAFGVVCDDDGTIYVSSTNPATVRHYIHTVVPAGCNPATVTSVQSSMPLLALSLDLDRAAGRFVATSLYNRPGFSGPHLNRLCVIDPVSGLVTVIAGPLGIGWGTLESVTVNNAMETYGAPSDGPNRHWFANFPNPTGHPYVGNTGFSLAMESAPGSAAVSVLSVSLGRGSSVVLGVEYLLDPAPAVTTFVASGTSVSYPLPIPNDVGLAGVTLTAQSLHLEANSALTTSRGLELIVQVLPEPEIDFVSPSAPLANATVTVTGRHFYNGMQLSVAGNPTPIVSQTETSLTFTMPSGVLCDSSMTLTNLGGGTNSAPINATPVIASMPTSGPAAGNAPFDVSGQYLDGATVTFNGMPMTNIVSQTSTAISGYTPPGTVGLASVVIASATSCQVTATYDYHAIPTISSIAPLVAGSGVPVTITGDNFLSGFTLAVGGNPTPITSWTATSVTFQMPPGNNCDTLVEITNVGNLTASRLMNRTPVVNFSSASGPATGGAIFYVTGQHLLGATVTFNGVPMTTITNQTATVIIGNTPPGVLGPAIVLISNALGCSTSVPYTYQ